MKIGSKLILIIGIPAVISVTVSGVVYYFVAKQAIEKRVKAQLETATVLKENHINDFIKREVEDIEAVAREKALIDNFLGALKANDNQEESGIYRENIKQLLEEKLAYKGNFLELSVLNLYGKIIVSTNEAQNGKFKSGEDYFIGGKRERYFQNFYYDIDLQHPVMTIATPIKDGREKVIGVLAGRLNLDKISDVMIERAGLGETGETYLVNKFNLLVSKSRFVKEIEFKKVIHTEEVKDCLKGNNGYCHYNDYRGTPVVGVYKWLPEREICLIAKIDKKEAFMSINKLKFITLLIGTGSVFLAVIIGLFLTQPILKPIIKLRDATKTISKGNLDTKIEVKSKDEIGQLAISFNQMVEDLNETTVSRDSLMKEVAVRKKAEETMKRLNMDLESTVAKLGRANNELKDFVYIASHDLREPLRKISSFGELLSTSLKDKLNDDNKENLDFMIDGAKRMQQMIDALLTCSRVTTKGVDFETVDLNQVVEELCAIELAVKIEETGAKIVTPERLHNVNCDPAQIRQLIQNLIANALKYQKKGAVPEITIRSSVADNSMVRVEVADNGIGIEEQHFKNLFVMFRRLHSRREYEGTGIGLAVCKKIVERHGGNIGVSSTYGEGSTFWFTLPASKTPEEKQPELISSYEAGFREQQDG